MLLMYCEEPDEDIDCLLEELQDTGILKTNGEGIYDWEAYVEDGFLFIYIMNDNEPDTTMGESQIRFRQVEPKPHNEKTPAMIRKEREDKFYEEYRLFIERFAQMLLEEDLIDLREMYEDLCL